MTSQLLLNNHMIQTLQELKTFFHVERMNLVEVYAWVVTKYKELIGVTSQEIYCILQMATDRRVEVVGM